MCRVGTKFWFFHNFRKWGDPITTTLRRAEDHTVVGYNVTQLRTCDRCNHTETKIEKRIAV